MNTTTTTTTTTTRHDFYCRRCQAAVTTERVDGLVEWVALNGQTCTGGTPRHELGFVDPTVEIPTDRELVANDSNSVDWTVRADEVKVGDRYRWLGHGFVQRVVTSVDPVSADGFVTFHTDTARCLEEWTYPGDQPVTLTNGTF